MWEDFAQYIINNYVDADKIVEVGVGKFHNGWLNSPRKP